MVGAGAVALGAGLVQIEVARRTGAFEPLPVGQVVACAVLAVPFSAGRFSPDADQRGLLKRWFGHRRAVHWWGWPVAVLVALAALGLPWPCFGPPIGWLSHLWPFDWLFGKGGRSIPKGIPLWPWKGSRRLGVGLRVTGRWTSHSVAESVFTALLFVILLAEGWWTSTLA
jgi:hypothetical protein